jgi:hypothetical protein
MPSFGWCFVNGFDGKQALFGSVYRYGSYLNQYGIGEETLVADEYLLCRYGVYAPLSKLVNKYFLYKRFFKVSIGKILNDFEVLQRIQFELEGTALWFADGVDISYKICSPILIRVVSTFHCT